jgi:hypothetical protein
MRNPEVRTDQNTLRHVMRSLGIKENDVRKAEAWAAEKAGRARLMIVGDEPGSLGSVLTLKGLIMGITGKRLMWCALAAAKLLQPDGFDLEEPTRRAEQQIGRIEVERIQAAQQVFARTVASQ